MGHTNNESISKLHPAYCGKWQLLLARPIPVTGYSSAIRPPTRVQEAA